MRSRMLRSKVMMPMFRLPFLCFSLVLEFGHIGYVVVKIFLIMHLFSFFDEFCTVFMSCMFPLSMQCSITYGSMNRLP